jgi:dipeptidase E
MKLYLSSIGIPTPEDLVSLLGKPLDHASAVLIPNAKDYYSERAWNVKVNGAATYMKDLGFKVTIADLRLYIDAATLKEDLQGHDLIWGLGGNTFVLRYEMRRSGFDKIIVDLLKQGVVYGGESAGALVAGLSIAGIESADNPAFTAEVITEGLGFVPYVVLPHTDNPEFGDVIPTVRDLQEGKRDIIGLKDNQAIIFEDSKHEIVQSPLDTYPEVK